MVEAPGRMHPHPSQRPHDHAAPIVITSTQLGPTPSSLSLLPRASPAATQPNSSSASSLPLSPTRWSHLPSLSSTFLRLMPSEPSLLRRRVPLGGEHHYRAFSPFFLPLSRPRRLTGAAEPPAFSIPTYRLPIPCASSRALNRTKPLRRAPPCAVVSGDQRRPRSSQPSDPRSMAQIRSKPRPAQVNQPAMGDRVRVQQPEGARHVDHGRRRMIEFARLLAIANARKHAA
ncbi:hypothetical protein HU200_061116 [Digitaria exilis]|uniref:Uncharacterized protein n=1 Tax=Digitaria exilis TaxID=1010633 RepID=A0A835A953_9POAL|nr:hypothetical protein HU200_061116 [Digitaria exilis]